MDKIIVANWKANPNTTKQAVALAKALDKRGVVVAPPYPFLEQVGRVLKKATLGAQDVFWADSGPYTGEVSLKQLKSLKVKYVILGHSERRKYLGETDELINKKVKAALKMGFKVILCVGEWKRKSLSSAKSFVKNQLRRDLRGTNKLGSYPANKLIIAYEPVWAISTGRAGADKPEDAVEMAKFIKQLLVVSHKLSVKVLYGGSVNAKNAYSFLKHKEIEGALVGGASLKPKEFRKVIK